MTDVLLKYPRTRHIEGSRLQPGDEDLDAVPFETLRGAHLVVEEKVDGANTGVTFTPAGQLRLQSRGHYLTGGPRERHFALFKRWAAAHREVLWAVLGDRYVMYGEWLYAKHTVFYDRLPHYFLEFDVLDRSTGQFLDTVQRHALLAGGPVHSVPVLFRGAVRSAQELASLIGPSLFKGAEWRDVLARTAATRGLDGDRVTRETDPADEMEGLYVKHEEGGQVVGRYKYIRSAFLQRVLQSDSHWLSRPIVPNQLRDDASII